MINLFNNIIYINLNNIFFLVLLIIFFNNNLVYADTEFQISGFGTLGYTVDDHQLIGVSRDFSQSTDAIWFNTNYSWKTDSRL